jgi:hypothetical protein
MLYALSKLSYRWQIYKLAANPKFAERRRERPYTNGFKKSMAYDTLLAWNTSSSQTGLTTTSRCLHSFISSASGRLFIRYPSLPQPILPSSAAPAAIGGRGPRRVGSEDLALADYGIAHSNKMEMYLATVVTMTQTFGRFCAVVNSINDR